MAQLHRRVTWHIAFVAAIACMATSSAIAQTSSAAQAGVAAAVRGDVRQVSLAVQPTAGGGTAVGRVVASGDRIYLGDKIQTGPQAGLQIMLLDETIFTIGPNAAMVIDKFVYDPSTDAGAVSASIVKGAFRFVSGRIAKRSPEDMNLRVGVATMGIRGTSAAGNVQEGDGPGNPPRVDVVLLGPGPDNNADERDGRITMDNGGNSVEISRPGYGTSVVGESGSPTPPVRLSLDQIRAITGGLSGGGDGSQGGDTGANDGNSDGSGDGDGDNSQTGDTGGGPPLEGGVITQLSGQTIGAGLNNSVTVSRVSNTGESANQQQETSAQNTALTLSKVATFDDLRSIETGTASFAMDNVPLSDPTGGNAGSGSYDAEFLVNFSARTLNVAIGKVAYNWASNNDVQRRFTYSDAQSFQTASGPTTTVHTSDNDPTGRFALYTGDIRNLTVDQVSGNSTYYCEQPPNNDVVRVEHEIQNDVANGTIASAARIDVTISDGDGNQIRGGATSPRL